MMNENKEKTHMTTTFQISYNLHTQLKMMCLLSHKSMGDFIRLAIIEKINQVKIAHHKGLPPTTLQ